MKQNETLVWVIYDIVEDKPRTKISKLLKKKGLYRVQKSVFLGTLESNRLDELELELINLLNEDQDSVYIFPMCKVDFKKVILLGQAFNKDLVSDNLKTLFL